MGIKGEYASQDASDGFNLSKKERRIYSLANLPNTILAGIFGLAYVNFFWDDLGLQQFYFVIGQIVYAVVNSLNDFYLGRVSDKTNIQKWGSRRLIYIKWGGILWAIVFFAMWIPWSYNIQIVIFIHFVLSICAFDMLLSLVWLVWLALLPELTESSEERTKISYLNQGFTILGGIPVLISFVIFEYDLIYFQIFAGICALICGSCYYIVGSKLRERPELHVNQETIPLGPALKQVLKSKSFVSMTIFRCFNHMNGSLGLSFIFAYLYIFRVDSTIASLLYFVLSTFITLIGLTIYKKLSLKIEMKTLIVRGRIIHIIVNIMAFFVLLIESLSMLIWVFLTISFIAGGYALFDYPIMMLVTDDDELINGERREGLIMGTNAFFIKIAESLGPIIGTTVLLLFGFVRDAPAQTPVALIGISFLLFIVQPMLNLIGLISMYFFPLYGENLKQLNTKLLEIHEQKTDVYKAH